MPYAETLVARHDVDVWLLWLDDQGAGGTGRLLALLSPDERERADRLMLPELRTRFTHAHGLKRTILARYTGASADAVRFANGPRGKPVLAPADPSASAPPPHFNMSHSAGLLAIAVCRSLPVGIDIEAVRRLPEGIARRFFSAREADALAALPAASQERAFFRVWTAKEAYVKALGVGIGHGLDRFAISVDPETALALDWVEGEPEAPRSWLVRSLPVPSGFAGALAVPAPADAVRVQFKTL